MHAPSPLLPVFVLAVLSGCQGTPTWSGKIRSMVAEECTTCHHTGGSAPFVFETYDEVADSATLMLFAMEAGSMPPWPGNPDCNTYTNERLLREKDIARFRRWVEADMPMGDETEPISVTTTPFSPTLTAQSSEPYTPTLSSTGDDYRCFLLDAEFEEEAWVTGSEVLPGSAAVHHVQVFAVVGNQLERALELDAEDETVGYTCFGGPLPSGDNGGFNPSFPTQIASWAPGTEPRIFADDLGARLEAGSRLVIQVHYSAVGGEAVPDQTGVALALEEAARPLELHAAPLAITDLRIPAGASDASFTRTFTNWSDEPAEVASLVPHMHLLGTSISARHVTADGEEAQCGVAVDAWDFEWTLPYRLEEPLIIAPGEGLEVTCTYDNSAENQPVVDGEQQDPRTVNWGDDTLDEMCLMYLGVVRPWDADAAPDADALACEPADACYAGSDRSFTSLMACEEASIDCALCTLQNGISCGLTTCALQFISAADCATECAVSTNAFGGSADACLRNRCPESYVELLTCADEVMMSGSCDEAMASGCGLSAP